MPRERYTFLPRFFIPYCKTRQAGRCGKNRKNNMKKTTLFLFGALCLLCASCEKEDGDARDAVVGSYSYIQVGSRTITKDGKTQTESLDSKGTFTIEKDNASSVGLKFSGSDLIKTGWIANKNTLCISAVKYSYTDESGITTSYTVEFSPCKVENKTFTTTATVSGAASDGSNITGSISLTAGSN